MRVAAVQLQCTPDGDAARGRAAELVARGASDGADLVVLPELFASLGRRAAMVEAAEPLHGPTVEWASRLARETGVWLVAGSFVERADGGRLFNTSPLFAPDGRLVAHYRKVHLFDVTVDGAANRESDTFAAGDGPVVHTLDTLPAAPTVGLTVCYDLRFPELYRIEALLGASVVAVPAAFTAATGRAHWELLVRARAVESTMALVAADQWGEAPNGIVNHGRSMVVDAWGTVLAEAPEEGDTVVTADIDLRAQAELRERLPSLANRRPSAYRWPDGEG
ncbi:carbon-nitrogen hydrolase family protein [Rhabdothermincola salaria]|uniref:carbon-nitrogen hydrolase family protein n=1 Tax=Rhabdothermincola salaria TaxID=2903142 RepID=UPI001E45CFBF|nr:carbon-nitrogen hydrolase family protein [Rhabdothermincola salaria]